MTSSPTARYIPYELAYGEAGRPPKIPAAACLVFIMEIMKIKGKDTTPKVINFPEWSSDELALWLEKDEKACQDWRASRAAKWEEGDAKLKEAHPTKEALDAWLDKQCLASKNKSLWKRTRTAKKKAAQALPTQAVHAVADSAANNSPPALSKEDARAMLTKAMDAFKQPDNKKKLMGIVQECEAAGGDAGMMKMIKLMPACQELLAPTLKEYGFGTEELMSAALQLQTFDDASIKTDVAKLMKAMQGDFSDFA